MSTTEKPSEHKGAPMPKHLLLPMWVYAKGSNSRSLAERLGRLSTPPTGVR